MARHDEPGEDRHRPVAYSLHGSPLSQRAVRRPSPRLRRNDFQVDVKVKRKESDPNERKRCHAHIFQATAYRRTTVVIAFV
jgi:hypothetical protein